MYKPTVFDILNVHIECKMDFVWNLCVLYTAIVPVSSPTLQNFVCMYKSP